MLTLICSAYPATAHTSTATAVGGCDDVGPVHPDNVSFYGDGTTIGMISRDGDGGKDSRRVRVFQVSTGTMVRDVCTSGDNTSVCVAAQGGSLWSTTPTSSTLYQHCPTGVSRDSDVVPFAHLPKLPSRPVRTEDAAAGANGKRVTRAGGHAALHHKMMHASDVAAELLFHAARLGDNMILVAGGGDERARAMAPTRGGEPWDKAMEATPNESTMEALEASDGAATGPSASSTCETKHPGEDSAAERGYSGFGLCPPSSVVVGTPVHAKFRGGSTWYEATIVAVNGNGTFSLAYLDGDAWAEAPVDKIMVPGVDGDNVSLACWLGEKRTVLGAVGGGGGGSRPSRKRNRTRVGSTSADVGGAMFLGKEVLTVILRLLRSIGSMVLRPEGIGMEQEARRRMTLYSLHALLGQVKMLGRGETADDDSGRIMLQGLADTSINGDGDGQVALLARQTLATGLSFFFQSSASKLELLESTLRSVASGDAKKQAVVDGELLVINKFDSTTARMILDEFLEAPGAMLGCLSGAIHSMLNILESDLGGHATTTIVAVLNVFHEEIATRVKSVLESKDGDSCGQDSSLCTLVLFITVRCIHARATDGDHSAAYEQLVSRVVITMSELLAIADARIILLSREQHCVTIWPLLAEALDSISATLEMVPWHDGWWLGTMESVLSRLAFDSGAAALYGRVCGFSLTLWVGGSGGTKADDLKIRCVEGLTLSMIETGPGGLRSANSDEDMTAVQTALIEALLTTLNDDEGGVPQPPMVVTALQQMHGTMMQMWDRRDPRVLVPIATLLAADRESRGSVAVPFLVGALASLYEHHVLADLPEAMHKAIVQAIQTVRMAIRASVALCAQDDADMRVEGSRPGKAVYVRVEWHTGGK